MNALMWPILGVAACLGVCGGERSAFAGQVAALSRHAHPCAVESAVLTVEALRKLPVGEKLRILTSNRIDPGFWSEIDAERSRIHKNGSHLLFLVTSEAHEVMAEAAPNLMSTIGSNLIEVSPREALEAMIFAGNIRDARSYAAEQTAMELGGLGRMLAPPTTKSRPASGGDHLERSHAWLREHRNEHRGCWVALLGDSLIGSDTSRKALQALVNAHPSAHKILVSWIAP